MLNKKESIPRNIQIVKDKLNTQFANCSDFTLREIAFGTNPRVTILVVFLQGLVDREELNNHILKPILTESKRDGRIKDREGYNLSEYLRKCIITTCSLDDTDDFQKTIRDIFTGDTVIYIEGQGMALAVGTSGWAERAVEEPATETVVRGPREGFVETLETNITLIRRKVKNPNLKFEEISIGRQTNTEVSICYIQGIADEELIQTVRERLNSIDTDAILESGYIEEFIRDEPYSLFPTVGNSEKPDKIVSKILEGRVAILCTGTPFVLTVPYLFLESLQASEDYYSGFYSSTILRLLRMVSLFISLILPGLYVALISFHQEVIPFNLLISLSASREGIPISPFLELLLMGLIFEILREAGIRLPRAVGQAVSIVGALVLGEASVRAGFVSNPIVIIVALTAISSFVVTPLSGVLPVLRIFLLISANVLGLLGLSLATAFIIIHLCSLQSFGVPYLASVAPLHVTDLKDSFVRMPLWSMYVRPKSLTLNNGNANKTKTTKK